MTTRVLVAAMVLASAVIRADPPINYAGERMAFAASKDYDAYGLQAVCYTLLKEYRDLATNSKASVAEINRPLQELLRIYPLGIQPNLAVAEFLEYVARNVDPKERNSDQTKALLDIASAKRKKAADILASIEASGDGNSTGHALVVINIMEELAVLESRGLREVKQSLFGKEGKYFDEIVADNKDGVQSSVYFDVSGFYRGSTDSK